jgi:ribosomal protein S18 acetylase RimI-like enzyme
MHRTPPTPAAADMSGSVRAAKAADTAAVSRAMASAFQDDPSFAWCIPSSTARGLHLPAFFQVVFDALLRYAECYCTPDGAAAALWVPPGQEPLTAEQAARLRRVFETVGAADAARFVALIGLMDAHHPHEEHFYLWFLGVSPGAQNQGLGSELLRSKLDWCDKHSMPAYLEATTLRNRQLYERNGFQVTRALSVAGSPPMWAMWRNPADAEERH